MSDFHYRVIKNVTANVFAAKQHDMKKVLPNKAAINHNPDLKA